MQNAKEIVEGRSWYHTFEVLPGLWTPGKTNPLDPKAVLDDHQLPKDLTGKRALDIGALDGPYTFELERRGAKVLAIDIQDPDRMGFNTAKKLRNSSAQYVQGNVYELTKYFDLDSFDIVVYFGVWYHLKNPLRALEQINAVLKINGIVCGEGECLITDLEFHDQNISAEKIAKSPIPLSVFHAYGYKGDPESWYLPNEACVRAWFEATSFAINWSRTEHVGAYQRMRVTAEKKSIVRVDNAVW